MKNDISSCARRLKSNQLVSDWCLKILLCDGDEWACVFELAEA